MESRSHSVFSRRLGSEGVTEGCFHRSSVLEKHSFSTFSIFCLNIYRCVSFLLAFLSCSSTQIFLKDFLPLWVLNPCGMIFFFFYPGGLAKPKELQNQPFAEDSKAWWKLADRIGFWQLSFSFRRFLFLEQNSFGGGIKGHRHLSWRNRGLRGFRKCPWSRRANG